MVEVVGVRFKRAGKIYDFDATGLDISLNTKVVVESDFGLSIGNIVKEKRVTDEPEKQLKRIIRIANEEDFKALENNRELEKEAFQFCLERIKARGMQMKLICTESTLDRKRIIFFFTADGRIDFRELVKDLAAQFRTRIEMRQIGVRDGSKLLGGIGLCGREFCCSSFLNAFEPVAIKMAKDQELVLNVAKLSGVCGRLMCCLRYEFDGDLKELVIEDEPPPIEDDTIISTVKTEATMAVILSSIDEEIGEEEGEINKNLENDIEPKDMNLEKIDDDVETNEEKRHENRDRKIEKRHFKKRRYFRK
ncbi:MAG: hypothetical protein N2738_09115 [Thermodesulfovibrionales bacterium]|nr:hypothetical protein [Thermodesulfovibrionales bacterium]